MKITRKQLRQLINEAMENPPFQFSINPAEYISVAQPIEEMNQMISLILDSDGISYYSERRDSGVKYPVVQYMYQFGYADDDGFEEDPESYKAFVALSDALKNAGVPTTRQANDDPSLRNRVSFSSSSGDPRAPIPVGYIRLRQYK